MVRINKVYTKAGDKGTTQLVGGDRVSKADARIGCYGTVDELNATLGLVLAALDDCEAASELTPILLRVQNELFNVGAQLATPDAQRRATMPNVNGAHIVALETEMDRFNEDLPELRSFVLPGGSAVSAALHLARTVCRRAERGVVELAESEDIDGDHIVYLNRLSDALFVFGRYALAAEGLPERLWEPEST